MVAALYAAPERLYRGRIHAQKISFTDPWPESWDIRWDKRREYGPSRPDESTYEGQPPAIPSSYTPEERLDLLTKAGALIAAEIDRLLTVERAEPK